MFSHNSYLLNILQYNYIFQKLPTTINTGLS
nr:MAG TPA: hypothetical protein [Caudoviricetes sp.]